MNKRNGSAVWNGPGKTGNGTVTVQSGLFTDAKYSHPSRFADAAGTNPEELIAAAHAGCFSMKLAFVLGAAGFEPGTIETTCTITIDNGALTNSDLVVKAKIDGISDEEFQKAAAEAKENCPVSKSINSQISLSATLIK